MPNEPDTGYRQKTLYLPTIHKVECKRYSKLNVYLPTETGAEAGAPYPSEAELSRVTKVSRASPRFLEILSFVIIN